MGHKYEMPKTPAQMEKLVSSLEEDIGLFGVYYAWNKFDEIVQTMENVEERRYLYSLFNEAHFRYNFRAS